MKELTIEERAKAYDESLKRAKEVYNRGYYKTGDIETIFPELVESEDEKIRKALINVFATHKNYEMFFGVSVEDIRAWLEKRGNHHIACSEEQMKVLDEVLNFAANHESSYWNYYIFETLNNLIRQLKIDAGCDYDKWIEWFEKQGGQKPFDYENATMAQKDFAPKGMTDSQYLDKALDFINEREKDGDYICCALHDIKSEREICCKDCQGGLDRICVLRFLKYYKKGGEE